MTRARNFPVAVWLYAFRNCAHDSRVDWFLWCDLPHDGTSHNQCFDNHPWIVVWEGSCVRFVIIIYIFAFFQNAESSKRTTFFQAILRHLFLQFRLPRRPAAPHSSSVFLHFALEDEMVALTFAHVSGDSSNHSGESWLHNNKSLLFTVTQKRTHGIIWLCL